MDLEGKLIQKLAVQSGKSARGDWAKQEFVIEYQDGNFPMKACFSVWGADRVKDMEGFREGDQIKVSFNVSSREYNGKWYTDLRAWRISSSSVQATDTNGQYSSYRQPQPGYGQPSQDMPAGFAPSAPQPSAPASGSSDMESDDLPF